MSDTPAQRIQDEPERIVVPVIREEVSVEKRTLDTGRGVRIHKTVAETPFLIDERLLHDTVEVDRVTLDRIVPLDQAPTTRYEGDTLVVPVVEEVLVVERRLRIKEELRITKRRHVERHAETVMLKSERVDVERFEDAVRDAVPESTREPAGGPAT